MAGTAARPEPLGGRAEHGVLVVGQLDIGRVSPGNRRTDMLAFHCSELPYLFGHLVPAEDFDEVDAQVSDTIQHAWIEFARTGVPSGPDGTPWPTATRTAPLVTVIDDKAHSCPRDVSLAVELINSLRVASDR